LIIALFPTKVAVVVTSETVSDYGGFPLGGAILWSRSFTPAASKLAASSQSPVNSLVREALIEGRTTQDRYEKDGYAIQWVFYNELELIFVVRH
jgi:signal recognition particle receptor subunit alpha